MADVVEGGESDDGEHGDHDRCAEVGDEFQDHREESPEQGAGHFQPAQDQGDDGALAYVYRQGDQEIAHDDALGLIDDLFGGLFVAPEGDDLDEFFDEHVAGGEEEVKEEKNLDQFADELGCATDEAVGQDCVWWRRPGAERRRGGGGGALGSVLELGGDFLDLLDGLAELVELLAGGVEALWRVLEPALKGAGESEAGGGHEGDDAEQDNGSADGGGKAAPFQPADDGAEERVEEQGEDDRDEEITAKEQTGSGRGGGEDYG